MYRYIRNTIYQDPVRYHEVEGVSPAPDLTIKITDALNVSIDELLAGESRQSAERHKHGRTCATGTDSAHRGAANPRSQDHLEMIDAMADRAGKRRAS